MKRIALFSFYLLLSWHTVFATTYTFTQAGGNWETAAHWQGGNMPPNPLPAGDNIAISANCMLNSSRTVSGTITINQPNRLTIQSGGSLIVDGLLTNSGTGSITVNDGGNLTINAGKTLSFNDGGINIFQGATVINNGLFNISNFSALYMSGTFTNAGTLTSATSVVLGVSSGDAMGTLTNTGTINNNGEFTLHGTLNLNAGGTFNNNGTLLGGGMFNGNFTNPPGGRVFVFGYGNNCVDFTGNFTNQGTLAVYYVGDTPCSSQTKLNVTGTVTLGGVLEVDFNIQTPITFSIVYTFIEAGSISGTFSTISVPNAPTSTVQYNNPGPGKATVFYNAGKTITASAGSGGSISPLGAVTVSSGANQSFSITPAMGNCIQSVLVDGNNVGAVASYTFSNVTADHTISASFAAANTWYLDADADGYYATTQSACGSPGAGWKSTPPAGGSGDCNDNDAAIYPGATDICDGKDNDCDNTVDEGGNGTPGGWAAGNVGGAINASSSFSCNGGTVFQITTQGSSPGINNDVLNSNCQQKCGDASITAHITGNPAPGWAGIFIREDLSAGSKVVSLKTNLNSFVRREVRAATNGNKMTQQSPLPASHTWVRLVRTGNHFTYYTSPNGAAWSPVGAVTVSMNACVYVGLFVEGANGTTSNSASFNNVTTTGSAPAPLVAAPGSGFATQDEQQTLDFQLYPNPAGEQVYLQWKTAQFSGESFQLNVFDALGQRVSTSSIAGASGELVLDQLSRLPNGAYWVQVQAPGFLPVTKRVVLQQ